MCRRLAGSVDNFYRKMIIYTESMIQVYITKYGFDIAKTLINIFNDYMIIININWFYF